MIYIEQYQPEVQYNGLNTAKDVNFSGTTTISGSTTISGATTLTGAVTYTNTQTYAAGVALSSSGTSIVLLGASGSATVAGGSAAVNTQRGVLDTGNLTTATLAVSSFDLVNNKIGSASQIFTSVYNGSNSGGAPVVSRVTVATTGSCTISILNGGGAALGALNGSLRVNFLITN
jgi:hypothetical protein